MTMQTPAKTDKLGFLIEPCSRCGGSGHYSRCESFGTKCFKCLGTKWARTKAGVKAYAAYVESLSVPLGSLVVGDLMRCESVFAGAGMFKIHSISDLAPCGKSLQPDGTWLEWSAITVSCGEAGSGWGLVAPPETIVRKGWTGPEKAAKLSAALATQVRA